MGVACPSRRYPFLIAASQRAAAIGAGAHATAAAKPTPGSAGAVRRGCSPPTPSISARDRCRRAPRGCSCDCRRELTRPPKILAPRQVWRVLTERGRQVDLMLLLLTQDL